MKTILFLTLSIILVSSSCKRHSSFPVQSSTPDCGCNGTTIDSLSSVNGAMIYDTNDGITRRPEYIFESIGLSVGVMQGYYYVCDTTFPALHALIDTNRAISYQVTLSGTVENFCTGDSIGYIAGGAAYTIHLTSLRPH